MADLTTSITESVTINGSVRGSTNSQTITGIIDAFERVVTCPGLQTTTIATFSDNVYDGDVVTNIDTQNAKYIRITNISAISADMELAVVGVTNYMVHMPAGYSHIICRTDDAILAEADDSPSFGTMGDIENIQARPTAGADVLVEIFVASA